MANTATVEERRLVLQGILEEIAGQGKVYFNPPENIKLSYPCIVYNRSRVNDRYADGIVYDKMTEYDITYITRDPREAPFEEFEKLPYCSHNRHYVTDNLHHDVFTMHI